MNKIIIYYYIHLYNIIIMYNLHSIIVLITSKSEARGLLAGVPLSCAADSNGIPALDWDW